MKVQHLDKLKTAIYGFAVGDALGVPYEGKRRDTFVCTSMVGYGTYNQPEGTWSDDTSMTLATCDAIKYCKNISPTRIMNNFVKWFRYANYTADHMVFDIGCTTADAIRRYQRDKNVDTCGIEAICANGNGSLMRILPLAFTDASLEEIYAVCKLTHNTALTTRLCYNYIKILRLLLDGQSLVDVLGEYYYVLKAIDRSNIASTGYVYDTLKAALWCVCRSNSYKAAVLKAVNLGGDTDTIAAITGSIAALVYGYDSIPTIWIEKLKNKTLIDECIDWRSL